MLFEWDPVKAEENAQKHDVTFEEASTIFGDPFATTIADAKHSHEEGRFVTLGESTARRLLVVVHSDQEDRIRIISARTATPRERRMYEEGE